MLRGTADLEQLARRAPAVTSFGDTDVDFEQVTLFQLVVEMGNGAREAVLPPSLHPTVPPALSLQVWQVGQSPWGAFGMAVARISCRAGVRARGFTTAALVSTDTAAAGLREGFGYPARQAPIGFFHSYSGVEVTVGPAEQPALCISAIDPVPLGADDVQYTGTLNAARVPAGLRLLQVEFQHAPERVERLRARLLAFRAEAWGEPRLDPRHVVSASLATGRTRFPPLRFLLKPDELAFTGTEAVPRQGGGAR